MNGITLTNTYDNLLRRSDFAILNSPSSILASTAYGYDAASRLATVSDGNGNTAGYSYLANSPLVGQIAFANNGAVRMTTTKQYDYLNRLTGIASVPASSFNYAYNSANQRTQVTDTDNSYWVYQYDNLGQVISGRKYWAGGAPVAGQQFLYNFDDIGNRTGTAAGGDATGSNLRAANYSANNLNQYTSRDVPGYATVLGSANPNATVTVNLQRAVRQGNYFWDELGVNNSGSSLYLSLTNLAVLNNGTNADIVATNVGNIFLPQTPETFEYDLDGNLTNSGRWNITWDAENRAVSFASLASAPLAAQKKVDCVYDYQGRRIQKIVSTNNGSAWIAVYTNKFVYDGWNLIAILDPQSSSRKSFMWGTDLSGSAQGAGGVGGLLSMTVYESTNAGSYLCCFDGNGNVSALVNAANGTTVGQWEYGPFGEVIRSTGPMAKANPIRFSTKYQDDETRLNYYGYRYYDPSTGRWPSRDPGEENGGVNVYGSCGNDSVDTIDLFGLLIECCKPETYFDGNKLTGMYQQDPNNNNLYTAKPGVTGPTSGDGLILWKMLQSSTTFTAKSLSVKQLKMHVAARQTITQNALVCNVTYSVPAVAGGGWNPAWTAQFLKDPQAFFTSINNPQTGIACQRIAEVIFQTGNKFAPKGHRNYDGIWIPGDWGYIDNVAYTPGGDWDVGPNNSNLGLQGENLICTGDDLFWGLFGAISPPESGTWWFDSIRHWHTSRSGKHAIP